MRKGCICNCGYRCGGPGRCKLTPLECLEQVGIEHFVRDCEHDFTGPMVHYQGGGSVTCKTCGMTAMDHDCMCGP